MKPVIKRLNSDEIKFFEEGLYPLQDEILKVIDTEVFYLTGGTCLSRFYYQHRYSEDLDLFFDGTKYPFVRFEEDFVKFVQKLKKNYKVEITITGENYKRLFVKEGEFNLKIEFVFEPYPRLGEVIRHTNYTIDTKENIAVNKLTALFTRKTSKDYYDLYFLLKEYDLYELLEKTELKMKPPAYEDLIISLKESFFEGEVLTANPIKPDEFTHFIQSTINHLLTYAKRI